LEYVLYNGAYFSYLFKLKVQKLCYEVSDENLTTCYVVFVSMVTKRNHYVGLGEYI